MTRAIQLQSAINIRRNFHVPSFRSSGRGRRDLIPLQYSSHSFHRWGRDKIETAVESGNSVPKNPKIQ